MWIAQAGSVFSISDERFSIDMRFCPCNLALLAVFLRMYLHAVQVIRGEAEWGDPLLSRERLASVKAINYAELLPEYETA